MSVPEKGVRSFLLEQYRRSGKPRTMKSRDEPRKKRPRRYAWVGNGAPAEESAGIGTGGSGGGAAGGGT